MSVRVTCTCGRLIKAKTEAAGRVIQCPVCKKKLRVPRGDFARDPDDAPKRPPRPGRDVAKQFKDFSKDASPTVRAQTRRGTPVWIMTVCGAVGILVILGFMMLLESTQVGDVSKNEPTEPPPRELLSKSLPETSPKEKSTPETQPPTKDPSNTNPSNADPTPKSDPDQPKDPVTTTDRPQTNPPTTNPPTATPTTPDPPPKTTPNPPPTDPRPPVVPPVVSQPPVETEPVRPAGLPVNAHLVNKFNLMDSSGTVSEQRPTEEQRLIVVRALIDEMGEVTMPEFGLRDAAGRMAFCFGGATDAEARALESGEYSFLNIGKLTIPKSGLVQIAFGVPNDYAEPLMFNFRGKERPVSLLSDAGWWIACLSSPNADTRVAAAARLSDGGGAPALVGRTVATLLITEEDPRVRDAFGQLQKKLASVPRLAMGDAALRKALGKTEWVEFDRTPLEDVIRKLEQTFGVRIFIDYPELAQAGVSLSAPVSISRAKISLEAALLRALLAHNLTHQLKWEALVITSRDRAEHQLSTKVYQFNPMKARKSDGTIDATPVLDRIRTKSNKSWETEGGPATVVFYPPDALVISQTEKVHAGLVSDFGRDLGLRHAPTPRGTMYPPTAAESALEAALSQAVKVGFLEQPLTAVLEQLRQQYKIPVRIDSEALQRQGIDPEARITVELYDITVASALRLLLDPLGLEYIQQDESLVVTTPVDRAFETITRVYPIDLKPSGRSLQASDFNKLKNVLTSGIAPESWNVLGGPGAVFVFHKPEVFVVTQTPRLQREVENVLATLGVLERLRPQAAPTNPILKALAEPVDFNFERASVSQVIDDIRGKHSLPLRLNTEAVTTSGISDTTPTRLVLSGVKLESALDLWSRSLGLVWIIWKDEVLLTTPVDLTTRGEVRGYSLRDLPERLLFPQDPAEPPILDANGIESLILETVAPLSWQTLGGTGTTMTNTDSAQLDIHATPDVHLQVERLLGALRRVSR